MDALMDANLERTILNSGNNLKCNYTTGTCMPIYKVINLRLKKLLVFYFLHHAWYDDVISRFIRHMSQEMQYHRGSSRKVVCLRRTRKLAWLQKEKRYECIFASPVGTHFSSQRSACWLSFYIKYVRTFFALISLGSSVTLEH